MTDNKTNKTNEQKIDRPHASFEEPQDVAVDPTLSHDQKLQVLDTLEQDARQMSVAADEGMAGGELNKLHDILATKEALTLSPLDFAYDVVMKDLQAHVNSEPTPEARLAFEQALFALEPLVAPAARTALPAAPDSATPPR